MKFLVLVVSLLGIIPGAAAGAAAEGKALYKSRCQSCHGPKGHGDGRLGRALKAADIMAELTEHAGDEAHVIAEVMRGGKAMPAWEGVLSEDQVKSIFAYIRQVQ